MNIKKQKQRCRRKHTVRSVNIIETKNDVEQSAIMNIKQQKCKHKQTEDSANIFETLIDGNQSSIFEEIKQEYYNHFGFDMFDEKHRLRDARKEIEYWRNENNKIQELLNPNDMLEKSSIPIGQPIGEINSRLLTKLTLIQRFYMMLIEQSGLISEM